MKISEFASKFGVKNDTVRYYMKLNLIIPEKRGGHYHFDKKCEADMEEVLKLKRMDFSLQEIKNIFNFKRIGILTPYQRNSYYQNLYREKVQDIERKIANLKQAKGELEKKLVNLKSKNKKSIKIGIDLSALSLFSCPHCNKELMLSAERVESNQVIKGSLNCNCGESLQIIDGILYTGDFDNNSKKIEDNHIEKYIKNTDPEFIDKSYQSLEWLQRQFELEDLSNKVIMEPGSGYGHFLRQIYNSLPEDTIYICIDNKPQINQYLKQLLEMTGERVNIIFITANLPELPLKENIVDLMVDFTGSSCYFFDNEGFLPELINPYLKKENTLIATFIIYHKFGPNNIVKRPYREYFRYSKVRDKLLELNYQLESEYKSDIEKVKESPGEYEDFAQPGDKIYSYQVLAKRWS